MQLHTIGIDLGKTVRLADNASTTPVQCCFVSAMAIYSQRIGRHLPKVSAFIDLRWLWS